MIMRIRAVAVGGVRGEMKFSWLLQIDVLVVMCECGLPSEQTCESERLLTVDSKRWNRSQLGCYEAADTGFIPFLYLYYPSSLKDLHRQVFPLFSKTHRRWDRSLPPNLSPLVALRIHSKSLGDTTKMRDAISTAHTHTNPYYSPLFSAHRS